MSGWPLRFMTYGAGEAINGAGALAPEIRAQLYQLSQVCTNSVVAATAQLDSSGVPSKRFVLDPHGRQPIQELPNVDVGDPANLIDFVRWSAAICPAQRSVLVLSGHGLAWQDGQVEAMLGSSIRAPRALPSVPGARHHPRSIFGSGVNSLGSILRAVLIDGTDRDFLSNAELGVACQQASAVLGRPIDVLVFDACLMSAWEILQELRDAVTAVVASIDELSAAGVDLAAPARKLSVLGGMAEASDIASTIAGSFTPRAVFDSCAAIDLSRPGWGAALTSFQAFSAGLLSWIQADPANASTTIAALKVASTSVVQYIGGGLADVGALADAFAERPVPAPIIANVKLAASALRTCVVGHSAGRDYQRAMGVSIFAPNSRNVFQSNRSDYMRLQFSHLTGWSTVLDALYGFDSIRIAGATRVAQSRPFLADQAEFAVSLKGFPIDAALRDRLEQAVRRTVLEKLAEVDAPVGASITPVSSFVNRP